MEISLIYETGVFAAVALWAMGNVSSVLIASKVYRENLRQVGLAPSAIDGKPVEVDAKYFDRPLYVRNLIAILFAVIGLATTLFSWIYVVLAVAAVLRRLLKDYGVPAEITEFRWRLKNQLMERDQILRGMMMINGLDSSMFSDYRESYLQSMRIRGYQVSLVGNE